MAVGRSAPFAFLIRPLPSNLAKILPAFLDGWLVVERVREHLPPSVLPE